MLEFASSAAMSLGIPGLMFVIWYFDQKRLTTVLSEHKLELAKDKAQHAKHIADILARYDRDMATVTRFYEDNVELVKGYEKLANDLAGIIHLNTQVQTELVGQVKNNLYCPVVRERGPQ